MPRNGRRTEFNEFGDSSYGAITQMFKAKCGRLCRRLGISNSALLKQSIGEVETANPKHPIENDREICPDIHH